MPTGRRPFFKDNITQKEVRARKRLGIQRVDEEHVREEPLAEVDTEEEYHEPMYEELEEVEAEEERLSINFEMAAVLAPLDNDCQRGYNSDSSDSGVDADLDSDCDETVYERLQEFC